MLLNENILVKVEESSTPRVIESHFDKLRSGSCNKRITDHPFSAPFSGLPKLSFAGEPSLDEIALYKNGSGALGIERESSSTGMTSKLELFADGNEAPFST